MRDLGTGLALVLVIEGILYALFPRHEAGRGAGDAGAAAGAARRRLLVAALGVVIVWLLRR